MKAKSMIKNIVDPVNMDNSNYHIHKSILLQKNILQYNCDM